MGARKLQFKELKKKYSRLKTKFKKSRKLLDKAVSMPIFVNMKKNVPNKIKQALVEAVK